MQMIARCKKVEEQTINGLNDQMIQTNDNHKFWTFRYVNETRNNTIYGQPYITEGGRLRLGSNHDEQWKVTSVFNSVEMMNKHPS